jgi:hypothetical protein
VKSGNELQKVLSEWPYDPDQNVRVVRDGDDRELLQVRLPMGIEQYELEGRPDGQRPNGRESALEYYRESLGEARAQGTEASFKLTGEECAELFSEAVLYYYRYLHLFHIQDWNRTERDTRRNIGLFDFVHRYAEQDEDRDYLEQWRPYLIRFNRIASAMMEVEGHRQLEALDIIREAIDTIETLDPVDNPTFDYERERSLATLQQMAHELEENRPLSDAERIEKEMHKAIAAEQYERAAVLRDQLHTLSQAATPAD